MATRKPRSSLPSAAERSRQRATNTNKFAPGDTASNARREQGTGGYARHNGRFATGNAGGPGRPTTTTTTPPPAKAQLGDDTQLAIDAIAARDLNQAWLDVAATHTPAVFLQLARNERARGKSLPPWVLDQLVLADTAPPRPQGPHSL